MLSTTDKTIVAIPSYSYIEDANEEQNYVENIRNKIKDQKNNVSNIENIVNHQENIIPFVNNQNNIIHNDKTNIKIELPPQEYNKFNDDMMLSYDDNECKFTFYNSNKSILGSFNIKQLIKYIGNKVEPLFFSNIETNYSEDLIKSMICEVLTDPITEKINIILKSHIESSFMGNLDLLIKLNNLLFAYENKDLVNDILIVKDIKKQNQLKMIIKQFIYLMTNHVLKIISIISDEIKNDKTKNDMKQKLLKYSVILTYKISNYMKEYLENYNIQYNSLNTQLDKLINMKKILDNKMSNLDDKITKQNELIFSIIKNKNNTQTNNTHIVVPNNNNNHQTMNNNIITHNENNNNDEFDKFFKDNETDNNYYESEYTPNNMVSDIYLMTDK